jgi:hypothetical protein
MSSAKPSRFHTEITEIHTERATEKEFMRFARSAIG